MLTPVLKFYLPFALFSRRWHYIFVQKKFLLQEFLSVSTQSSYSKALRLAIPPSTYHLQNSMNNSHRVVAAMVFSVLLAACSDSSTPTDPATPNSQESYFPLTKGSTWMYNGLVTYTATMEGDTIVGGKTYQISRGSTGGTSLVRKESGNYYQTLITPPNFTEIPMLKENAPEGTSWEYDGVANSTLNHYVYVLEKRDLKYTVNGKEYSDVIKVNLKDTLKISGISINRAPWRWPPPRCRSRAAARPSSPLCRPKQSGQPGRRTARLQAEG